MTITTLYANNLRKIRLSRGLSQVQMAQILSISKSELSRIERGEVGDGWTPHICETLGVTREQMETLSVIETARWALRQEAYEASLSETDDDPINQWIHETERRRLGMRVGEYVKYAGLSKWRGRKVRGQVGKTDGDLF